MLLGPVFRAELSRVARRPRNYALRVLYVLGLLLAIWQSYENALWSSPGPGAELSIREMAAMAQSWFIAFATVQLVMILVLVPPLFGGAIADEKQRRTLHYLMASRLSGGEIVLDKLLGRLLHLGVFVALGLPVMSLLLLLGGIPIEWVAIAYLGTASVTFFLASLTVLVSTLARRVRQAVLVAYMLELYWLFGPALTGVFLRIAFPRAYDLVAPALDWFVAGAPFVLFRASIMGPRGPSAPALADAFVRMVGLQFAAGLALLLAAVWQLRPAFRRQEGGRARLDWFGPRLHRRVRFLRRPPCGDDAIRWKEKYFTRTDVFTKFLILPTTAVLTVALVLSSGFDESIVRALNSLGRTHEDLNAHLRMISPWYVALWLLAVAGASASCVTIEREKDTWVSLTSTPLGGREVLLGKLYGAVWNLRGFAALVGLIWLFGLIGRGIHPLGLLAGLGAVGVLTWFVAALGTYASLTSRGTSRALGWTIAVLLGSNVGVVAALSQFIGGATAQRVCPLGLMPHLAAQALLTADPIHDLRSSLADPKATTYWAYALATGAALLVGYALAATWLTRRSIARFDDLVGRPSRDEAAEQTGKREEKALAEPVGA